MTEPAPDREVRSRPLASERRLPTRTMRRVAVPAYLVAAILVFFPVLDAVTTVWPPRSGDLAWRFGAAGLVSRSLVSPFLGLLITFSVALLLDHRRTLRLFAVVTGLLALSFASLAILFALDSVQMRARVAPESLSRFDLAWLVGIGKLGVAGLSLLTFTIVSWIASRSSSRRARRRQPELDSVALVSPSDTRATSSATRGGPRDRE